MTTQRFQQLAHWGEYTAVAENGRLVHCEPFVHDPEPSPMLGPIPGMAYSPTRIQRLAVRKSWLAKHARAVSVVTQVSLVDLTAGLQPDAFIMRAPSVLRQLEVLLCKAARARVTLARMSLALAVQMKGLGLVLCTAM